MSANLTPLSNRFLVPAIIALGISVVGLNVGLFLTVNSHVQSIRVKEGEIDTRERAVTSLERELARINTEIAQATERRSNAMQLKEDAEKSASDAQLQRQQRDQLVERVRALTDQRVGLDGDLSKLKNQIAESQEEANRAIAAAKAALAQRDTDVARAQTEKNQLNRSIAELEATRERAVRDRDVAVKEAADAVKIKNDRDTIARELETVTQQLNQRKTDSERLASQITVGNSEEADVRKRRTNLDEQLKKLESDIRLREIDHAALQKRISDAREEAVGQEKLATTVRQLKADRDNLAASVEKIQQQLAGVNVELSKRGAEVSDLKNKEAELRTALVGMESDTKRAHEARTKAEEQLAIKRSELDRANIDLNAARADLERTRSMQTAINVSEDDVRRASKARDEAVKAAIAAAGNLKDLQKQLNDVRQPITSPSDKAPVDSNSPRE